MLAGDSFSSNNLINIKGSHFYCACAVAFVKERWNWCHKKRDFIKIGFLWHGVSNWILIEVYFWYNQSFISLSCLTLFGQLGRYRKIVFIVTQLDKSIPYYYICEWGLSLSAQTLEKSRQHFFVTFLCQGSIVCTESRQCNSNPYLDSNKGQIYNFSTVSLYLLVCTCT